MKAISHYSEAQLRAAVDDLVRRGVVELLIDADGQTRYCFPDAETGKRLLDESRRGCRANPS